MLLVIGKSALELHSKCMHLPPPPPFRFSNKKSFVCRFGFTTVSSWTQKIFHKIFLKLTVRAICVRLCSQLKKQISVLRSFLFRQISFTNLIEEKITFHNLLKQTLFLLHVGTLSHTFILLKTNIFKGNYILQYRKEAKYK
jgi:hypothetical protein